MDITFDFPQLISPDSSPAEIAKLQKASTDLASFVNGKCAHNVRSGGAPPASFRQFGEFVTFTFPYAFTPSSSHTDNAFVLRACLDYLTYANRLYLSLRKPLPGLFDAGVYYARTQIWDSIPALYKRGYGDCKTFSAALIAQYLQAERDALPSFRFFPRGPGYGTQADYHILVQTEEGFEDPSKILGMPHSDDY